MAGLAGRRAAGPLAPHVKGFTAVLVAHGYAPSAVRRKTLIVVALGRFMGQQGLDVAALDVAALDAFVADRRRQGCPANPMVPATGMQLLDYLDGLPPGPSPAGQLLSDYRQYLVEERGLAPVTVAEYLRTARRFLAAHHARLDRLGPRDVTAFVLRQGRGLQPRSVNGLVGQLRSLLRYLHRRGLIASPLAYAALRAPSFRESTLPKGLPAGQLEALLASCDRRSLVGARDFAIITVLARLGLRACEVARLELSDIDWRRGVLSVRGKGRRAEVLPLPVDVGEVLAEYLARRGRQNSCRQVFLHVGPAAAPGIGVTDVHAALQRACRRAGLPRIATHRLRYSAATSMLAAGASLAEIGEVLRHGHPEMTARYAKVDAAALMSVAKPWPGARS